MEMDCGQSVPMIKLKNHENKLKSDFLLIWLKNITFSSRFLPNLI